MSVGNEEIAAVVSGMASPETIDRVTAAAERDGIVREKLALLRTASEMPDDVLPDVVREASSGRRSAQLARLEQAMRDAARRFAAPISTGQEPREPARPPLTVRLRRALTLPALAPAWAAAASPPLILRENVAAGDEARVIVQQLPGAPPRLRVIVIAERLRDEASLEIEGLGEIVAALNQDGCGWSDWPLETPGAPSAGATLIGVLLRDRTEDAGSDT